MPVTPAIADECNRLRAAAMDAAARAEPALAALWKEHAAGHLTGDEWYRAYKEADAETAARFDRLKQFLIKEGFAVEERSWVRMHKDGDVMSVSTNCDSESEFIERISEAIDDMIARGKFISGTIESTDWAFQLGRWLPQIVDIVCSLRGYQSSVEKRLVLIAGSGVAAKVIGEVNR